MAYIYLITNKLNNMQYVGQCLCAVKERFMAHFTDSNHTIPLHRDMQLYGIENFDYQILDEVNDDIRLDVETYYIDKLATLQPNGYNVWRHSSEGFSGKSHSELSIHKLSLASKLWWKNATQEQKDARAQKISQKLTGAVFSEEHRHKLSEKAKLRVADKNPFFGKLHTSDSIEKMREASRKYIYVMCNLDNTEIARFTDFDECAEHVRHLLGIKSKLSSIQYRIREVCYGKAKSAYGYSWKKILKSSSKCNDYSNGDEISQ